MSRRPSLAISRRSSSAIRPSEVIHEDEETASYEFNLFPRSSFSSYSSLSPGSTSRKLHRRGSSLASSNHSESDLDFKCAGADTDVEAEWWADRHTTSGERSRRGSRKGIDDLDALRRCSGSSNNSSSSDDHTRPQQYFLPHPHHSRRLSTSPVKNYHYPSASISSVSSSGSTSSSQHSNSNYIMTDRIVSSPTTSPISSPRASLSQITGNAAVIKRSNLERVPGRPKCVQDF